MKRLKEFDTFILKLFSERWKNLHSFEGFGDSELKWPGVYLIAYSKNNLDGRLVESDHVFYVGMSNSSAGVGSRIKQFKAGIEKYGIHSAAMRFYRIHCKNMPFSKAKTGMKLFFVSIPIKCESNKHKANPDDFRKMGHVACLEQYAIAYVQEQTGKCPALNIPERRNTA
jgi:hypothetical protein